MARYRLGPMFTPPSVSKAEGPIATLTMGAQAAATNWPGGSYDPGDAHGLRRLADVHRDAGSRAAAAGAASDVPYSRAPCCPARAARAGRVPAPARVPRAPRQRPPAAAAERKAAGRRRRPLTVQGLPIVKPPYSRITAIDLDSGEFRWQSCRSARRRTPSGTIRR